MEFSISEITQATGGSLHLPPGLNSRMAIQTPLRLVMDSREARAGSLFWPLHGVKHDGHRFVRDAFSAGASCAVIGQEHSALVRECRYRTVLVVDDTYRALCRLAAWNRSRRPLRMVAVTGSFGKTTTRELVAAALSSRFKTHRSPGNFNNHFGVPLTLLGLKPHHDAAVVELGASAIGEIQQLAELVRPEVGIITGIGHAHAAEFDGIDNIVRAKGELAEAITPQGLLILPGDDPRCRSIRERATCRVITVGSDPHDHVTAQRITANGRKVTVTIDGTDFTVQAAGRHFSRSVLFAVAVAREFGLSDAETARGLASFEPVPGRCQVIRCGGVTIIDDTYNASPEAMRAGIELLAAYPASGRRLLVAGDMAALGDLSAAAHEEAGVCAAENRIDCVLTFGQHAAAIAHTAQAAGIPPENAVAFSHVPELLSTLFSRLRAGDVVLVKGSRVMRMERVVEAIRQRLAAQPCQPQPGSATATDTATTSAT